MIDINFLHEKGEVYENYLKIQEDYEKLGKFNEDVNENTMDNADHVTDDFVFIHKGFKYWLLDNIYNLGMKIYTNKVSKLLKFEVKGKENLKGVKSAIVTCNHVSLYDSFAVRKAVGTKINFIAAEFNNFKGEMGIIGRHTGYLPIVPKKASLMKKLNKAVAYYAKKGKKILVYPEQSMWRNYKKPRKLQIGAYHFAVTNNIPVLPLFITFRENAEDSSLPFFTINILPPIYKDSNLSDKENKIHMRNKNFKAWKDCYEETYGEKLTYTTLDLSTFDEFNALKDKK